MSLGLFLADPVWAATATKLSITTPAQTLLVGKCSAITTVQSQNSSSVAVVQSTGRKVSLSGTSFTFYSNATCSTRVSSVKIAAGASTANFYFKSNVSGTRAIKAASTGLTTAKQKETINAAPLVLRPIPYPLYGVTVDAIDHLQDILQSLQNLVYMPTVRVVFDEWIPATDYRNAVSQMNSVSFVVGEILDSSAVEQYTVNQYQQRTTEYLDTIGSLVDIWEIGNEINGEWLGTTPGEIPSVVAKMTGAYDLVKARGGRTALTLYYNEDCWTYPSEEMFTWADANIPADMKQELDYVLVSYYEEDCNNLRPDWPTVFERLAAMFPNSKIGFGETGTSIDADKADTINRYYPLQIDQPNYIGGYFWWYFKEDMVPYTNPLWSVLNAAIQ